MWGEGGSKNWASSFRVILGFLVVSLQFEPADARVLVEHPVPRCPSCTPVLFGVHVNSSDARVLVEHPVPRCPSGTPAFWCTRQYVRCKGPGRASCPTLPEWYARAFWCTRQSPPPDKYFIIIPCETNIFSCHGDILNSLLEYFHHSDVRTEFLH